MRYKALMLDVDGTVVPYDYTALPSDTVAATVQKAQEKLTVCLVTGRSFAFIEKVLEKLSLHSGYAVVNNGTLVLNIKTKEFLYKRAMNVRDAKKIVEEFRKRNIPFYLKQDEIQEIHVGETFSDEKKITTPYMFLQKKFFLQDKLTNS